MEIETTRGLCPNRTKALACLNNGHTAFDQNTAYLKVKQAENPQRSTPEKAGEWNHFKENTNEAS